MEFTLGKNKKLKSRKAIAQLFQEGKVVKSYPVKVIYAPNNLGIHKVAFSVPKRNFKLAVDRNRIKRLLREAYRLNQHTFFEGMEGSYNLMFIYMNNKYPDYQSISGKVKLVLTKVRKSILED